MRDEVSSLRASVVLAFILVVGGYLRWLPLDGVSFGSLVVGDTLEYQRLALFFLDTDLSPPGNRFPGFAFLLAGLFYAMPFSHDAIQIVASLSFGIATIALTYVLAAGLGSRSIGLTVAALVAAQSQMVHNSHRGLTEELFLVLFLSLLIMYRHARTQQVLDWRWYSALGVLGGAMALVRPDSAYAVVPIFLTCMWREKHHGWHHAVKTLPVVVLPFALPALSQSWMEGLGIQNMNMRAGRGILWMEFMIGRMPYEYMFYKETHVRDWLFGHHTLAQLAVLGVKSSVRNLLALGEALWGQLALCVALAGAVAFIRKDRDWVVPLAVPLAILPQWGLVGLWPEVDVGRYNIRVVPVLLIFLALGTWQLAAWLRPRVGLAVSMAPWLPACILAPLLAVSVLPWSLSHSLRPAVDILYVERQEYHPKSSKVHKELAVIWSQMAQLQISLTEATESASKLREAHDAYAPTHFVLGVLAMQQGQRGVAITSLERALEIVPFFAEAAVLLAELYTLEDRHDEASSLLQDTSRLRPDYPLIALLTGHLQMIAGDLPAAGAAYEEFLRLNRYQYTRALVRHERIVKRESMRGIDRVRLALDADTSALTTPIVWDYLSLDLKGIVMPPPADRTAYFNLGVCDLRNGKLESAEFHWQAMTRVDPDHADAWFNLGQLQASHHRLDEARDSWERALMAEPGHGLAINGLLRLANIDNNPDEARYARVRIILPMTRSTL